MLRQRPWDKHEAAILLDALIRVRAGELDRKKAISSVSEMLRRKATNEGLEIDDVYRNVNGITFQMHSMESAYVGYTLVKPATKLFQDVALIEKYNRSEFEIILKEANALASSNSVMEDDYLTWLSLNSSSAKVSELYMIYVELSVYFLDQGVLQKPLLETTDLKTLSNIKNIIEENRVFRNRFKGKLSKITPAISQYISYLNEYNERQDETNDIEVVNEYANVIEKTITDFDNNRLKVDNVQRDSAVNVDDNKKAFLIWMIKNGMADATARSYVSSVRFAGEIAQELDIIHESVFEITDTMILKDAIVKLLVAPNFLKKNEARHNQLRAAWIKYVNFSGDPDFSIRDIKSVSGEKEQIVNKDSEVLYRRLKSMARVYDDIDGFETRWIREQLGLFIELDDLEETLGDIPWITEVRAGVYSFSKNAKPMIAFDKDSLTKVLMMRYQNGMQFDSIDLEIFRETYNDIIGQELKLTDKELMTCLCKSGVVYKGRVFPPEGIIGESVKGELLDYIEKSFSEGRQVLYYKAIFEDLSELFAYCFNLTDAMMLKPYLEYVCNPDDYCFTDEYISKEKGIKIDHSAEVEEYILIAGKPLSYEEIYAGLSHISKEIVYSVIKTSPNIILNEKEHYFHMGIFEFSSEDADKITDYIDHCIEEDGYCIWSLVFETIKEKMPIFIENNVYLSSIGIRNAVSRKLSGRFHFDGEVVSRRGEAISMADVYKLYGKHHAPFSDDDIYEFAKEVSGGVIYFDYLSETTVRVRNDLFVLKEKIHFDIDATDSAISTYFESGYMLVRDIDSFLVFPNVGYEWNEYLLESYLMYYSKNYALYNNGRSLNNVAGAVVKKDSGIDEFSDICADVISKSGCELTKNKALDYLVEVNLLTRRSYKKIDSVLVKAKQIRNRKE